MKLIELPDEVMDLLKDSRLGGRPDSDQVRAAIAIHLFQEGIISIGKAAELANVQRVEFEELLADIGIPVVKYDVVDYDTDSRGIAEAQGGVAG